MLFPTTTRQFERDREKAGKQKKDLSFLIEVMQKLIGEKNLDPKYCDHPLKGKWSGFRNCHVQNDWVLIYKVDKREKIITFVRLGTHAELFK